MVRVAVENWPKWGEEPKRGGQMYGRWCIFGIMDITFIWLLDMFLHAGMMFRQAILLLLSWPLSWWSVLCWRYRVVYGLIIGILMQSTTWARWGYPSYDSMCHECFSRPQVPPCLASSSATANRKSAAPWWMVSFWYMRQHKYWVMNLQCEELGP